MRGMDYGQRMRERLRHCAERGVHDRPPKNAQIELLHVGSDAAGVRLPTGGRGKFSAFATTAGFLFFNQPLQLLNRQNGFWIPMRHAVAVGAKRAEVGDGINFPLAVASQRVEVMHLDVGTGIGRAVELVEVESARHARRPVRTCRHVDA